MRRETSHAAARPFKQAARTYPDPIRKVSARHLQELQQQHRLWNDPLHGAAIFRVKRGQVKAAARGRQSCASFAKPPSENHENPEAR